MTAEKINGNGFGLYGIALLRDHPDFPSGGMKTRLEIPTSSCMLFYPVHAGKIPDAPSDLSADLVVLLENLSNGKKIRVAPDMQAKTQDGGYPWSVEDLSPGSYRIGVEGGGSEGYYPSGLGQEIWLYPGAPDMGKLDFVVSIP